MPLPSTTPEQALSTPELVAALTALTGHLNAAQHRFLVLLAEFDRRQGWSDGATHSCAHWLNWQLGIDLGAAREKVRVAHALADLPQVSAAMAEGRLSYSKVRALTRVADAATESYLLSVALHGTAWHVERVVRAFRRAREAAELGREARQQLARGVHWHYDDDGSLVLKATLPAEAGAALLKALEAAGKLLPPKNVSAETPAEVREQPDAHRADALALLADSFLSQGPGALNGGDRQQIIVHVDAETLRERTPGRCELDDGPSIAAETARRLACDSSVLRIVEDADGQPLDVGRKTRSIPPALRRALAARDRGCRFPGCTHTRFVDGHHIQHWADGGETRLSNLVTLCRFHHRRVHEGGMRIEVLDDGALRFVRADGDALDPEGGKLWQQRVHWSDLQAARGHQGAAIDPRAAATGWRGESMNLGLAIECLMQRWEGPRVSAET